MLRYQGVAAIVVLYSLFLVLFFNFHDSQQILGAGRFVYRYIAIGETLLVALFLSCRPMTERIRCGFNRDFLLFTILAILCSILPFAIIPFATSSHVALVLGFQVAGVLAIGLASMVEAFAAAISGRSSLSIRR